jgi:hypothetical protein
MQIRIGDLRAQAATLEIAGVPLDPEQLAAHGPYVPPVQRPANRAERRRAAALARRK